MPRPIAEVLADEYVVHGYRTLQIQESIFEQVDKLIVRLHREMATLVRDTDPADGASTRKVEFLQRRSRKLIDETYREVSKLIEAELLGIAELEQAQVRSALNKAFAFSLEDEL